MITLALDSKTWDLYVDENKNIAIKTDSQQIAQDVASSVRVFKGELPFDITRGVAYNNPEETRSTLNFDMRNQALLVNGVSGANVVFDKLNDRELSTTIYVTTDEGEEITIR